LIWLSNLNTPISFAYPNPFNSSTTIRYSLPATGRVSLGVYELSGRLVETLVDRMMSAGRHEAVWEAANQPAGLYFCRIQTEGGARMSKMTLLQ